ncbi:MAG: quinolinate synthase NadA [Lactobacillaceae bacterium]|jgi:quinolinate synthase|nr:quinolinate synthase NadA [Lactobacillaceae bacterium]
MENVLDSYQNQLIPEEYLAMPEDELRARIKKAKATLGDKLLFLAHHYQKDEVVEFADQVGDSLALAQIAQANKKADYILFCGVHFMAETADILTQDRQSVILPDLAAGCSMADMVNDNQLERAWHDLQIKYPDEIIPITYVNSTAAVKAFVGAHGGVTCTSSNAASVLEWAFTQKKRVFFLPDQHLGRNTAVAMGIPLEEMGIWDPIANDLIADKTDLKIILWNGWCSVHQQFTGEHVDEVRRQYPGIKVIVHPECQYEVVQKADVSGSTNKILNTVKDAPAGSKWAVGTDNNLVARMASEIKDKEVVFLNPISCACMTMNRIKLPHVAWALENLVKGNVVNQIKVDPVIAKNAAKALDQMLLLS